MYMFDLVILSDKRLLHILGHSTSCRYYGEYGVCVSVLEKVIYYLLIMLIVMFDYCISLL